MNRTLVKNVKIIFDIAFWLGILVTVLATALFALLPTITRLMADSGQNLGDFNIAGAEVSVDLSALDPVAMRWLAFGAGFGVVLSLVLSTAVVHQIRRALGSVLEGQAFRHENYGRIRTISYLLFAMVPIQMLSDTFVANALSDSWEVSVNPPLTVIGMALLVLAIAEIYKAGISLQDEAELTI